MPLPDSLHSFRLLPPSPGKCGEEQCVVLYTLLSLGGGSADSSRPVPHLHLALCQPMVGTPSASKLGLLNIDSLGGLTRGNLAVCKGKVLHCNYQTRHLHHARQQGMCLLYTHVFRQSVSDGTPLRLDHISFMIHNWPVEEDPRGVHVHCTRASRSSLACIHDFRIAALLLSAAWAHSQALAPLR